MRVKNHERREAELKVGRAGERKEKEEEEGRKST